MAAAFDSISDNVHAQRLKDPSRDMPGHVQVVMEETVALSIEARAEGVSRRDVDVVEPSTTLPRTPCSEKAFFSPGPACHYGTGRGFAAHG